MTKRILLTFSFFIILFTYSVTTSYAFWIWTPKTKKMINPKHAVKDTPEEQFRWAMRFYDEGDFQRAADEFIRLTDSYPDSDIAPNSQYYAGRAFEELGKYWFAYQNYQKTIDNYPYTKRLDELIEREYHIASIFESQETAKFMEFELSDSMDKAATIYSKIVDNSPFGPYADKALFKLGDVNRRMMKYDDAITAYERIINDYPESTLVPEAKYQLAYTKYEASLDPEYDQESTDQALREFKEIAKTTPVPAVAQEADKVLDELKAKKAESTLKIAEFYDQQGKHTSALIYYKTIVGKFSGTSAAEYAAERIEVLEEKINKRKKGKK